jgi:hypothetical protein
MSKSKEVEDFARDRLRPYVETPAFREYLKGQILEWEAWYSSQVEEIRWHEIARGDAKERLDRAISQGTFDPEDEEKDLANVLRYDWHEYEVTSIPANFEFKLVAEGEPVLFQEASVAAMVALFWCDINHSSKLVPDYSKLPDFDPLDPYGPFNKYLFEQWRNPVPGRYKYIHWFVDAAIHAYESRIVSGGVEETGSDSIVIVHASQAIPEANQALQVSPPISEVTPPHVQPISTDDSLDETRIEGCSDKRVESPPGTHRHTAKERETAFDEPTDPTNAIPGQPKRDVKTASNADTQASHSTGQAETNQQELVEMERNTPALDTGSINWIAARKKNQKKLGYPTNTLSTYRLKSSGGRQLSPYFGVDKDGRRWRRQPDKTEESTVYYFANDIEKYQPKASN